ncbi:MAG: VanZ family protein [Muribaculaceae bacterium]|nr:VanZ family protein [Muribaculaceae bacterium]
MESLRKVLSKLPAWLLSIVTLLVILWLTLAPKPLGDETPMLFPGADKLVHGIMFGFLGTTMMLDWQRKNRWKLVFPKRVFICATLSAILGVLIEVAQANMGLGRGFEYGDIVADTIGAYVFGIVWMILQKNWVNEGT